MSTNQLTSYCYSCKIDGRNAYTTWLDYDENKLVSR